MHTYPLVFAARCVCTSRSQCSTGREVSSLRIIFADKIPETLVRISSLCPLSVIVDTLERSMCTMLNSQWHHVPSNKNNDNTKNDIEPTLCILEFETPQSNTLWVPY